MKMITLRVTATVDSDYTCGAKISESYCYLDYTCGVKEYSV